MIKAKVVGGIGEKKSNNNTQWYQHDRIYEGNVAITITTECNPYYQIGDDEMLKGGKQLTETLANIDNPEETQMLDLYNRKSVEKGYCQTIDLGYHNSMRLLNNCKIRKLTPRECFRLMGVADYDIDKVLRNQSDSSLYHLAGDSIVVNVLMAIFKEMI